MEEVMSRSSNKVSNLNLEGIEPLDFKKDKLPVINYKIQMFDSQISKLKTKAGIEI